MKKIFIIFIILFSFNAFAYYTENIPNKCGIVYNDLHAVFTQNVHTCANGYYLPKNTDECRPCISGQTCSGGTYSFNERFDQGIVFSSYTCNAGYFLPANVDGCRQCPAGYTCNGGTFVFNPRQSQGAQGAGNLITQNVAYACATNFSHKMHAIFTPNTININIEGVNTPTSCTYGDTISLPNETPTRVGYTFSGWQVKSD